MNEDGSIPQTAKWNPNFLDPELNNYRQNQQGEIPPTALPNVTTDTLTCTLMGDTAELSAEVCNRGFKTIGAGLKTAFYEGAPKDGKVLCVATTVDALESEQCAVVTCQHDGIRRGYPGGRCHDGYRGRCSDGYRGGCRGCCRVDGLHCGRRWRGVRVAVLAGAEQQHREEAKRRRPAHVGVRYSRGPWPRNLGLRAALGGRSLTCAGT